MKKIILILVLFFNLLPCIKKGKLSFFNVTTASADGFGDEGLEWSQFWIKAWENVIVSYGEITAVESAGIKTEPSGGSYGGNTWTAVISGTKWYCYSVLPNTYADIHFDFTLTTRITNKKGTTMNSYERECDKRATP